MTDETKDTNTNNTSTGEVTEVQDQSTPDSAASTSTEEVKKKEPMTLSRVKTKRDFFGFMSLQKANLGKTLMSTLLYNQDRRSDIFIASVPTDMGLSIVQNLIKALNSLPWGEKSFERFSSTSFQFELNQYILAKSDSVVRQQIEDLQKATGGLQSDTVEDVGTIRIIFFSEEAEYPDGADFPLYKMLKKVELK